MRAFGIDVSHWQGKVDWDKVKAKGVTFAYIKATQGANMVDPQFIRNWAEAKRVGLLRGAYHFAETGEPMIQANHFITTLSGDFGELPAAYDAEVPGLTKPRAATWCQTVGAFTKCLIYTRDNIWDTYSGTWARGLPLWEAEYPFRNWNPDILNITENLQPKISTDFATWEFWQVSEKAPGREWGMESHGLDLNVFNGTAEDLREKYAPRRTLFWSGDIGLARNKPGGVAVGLMGPSAKAPLEVVDRTATEIAIKVWIQANRLSNS